MWPFYFASFYTQWAFILLGGIAFQVIVWIYGAINWTYHFAVAVVFFWCMPCRFLLDWAENLVTLPFELFEWAWAFVLWVIDFAFVWWIKLFFWEGDDEEPTDEENTEEMEDGSMEEENMMANLPNITMNRPIALTAWKLYPQVSLRQRLEKKFTAPEYDGTKMFDFSNLSAASEGGQCYLSKFFA